MVKETNNFKPSLRAFRVSIPSRGSGKGDISTEFTVRSAYVMFQSPLGEVVKETQMINFQGWDIGRIVSIPSRGSGKGDLILPAVSAQV